MNTIVNTRPPAEELFNPNDRPSSKVLLNDLGQIIGVQPRPLLLIGREPVTILPSRRALNLLDTLLALSWEHLEHATTDSEFTAHGQFLRNQIGEGSRSSNDRLDDAFNEHIACDWRFPVTLMSGTHNVAGVLADWSKQQRRFVWRFTSPFIALCQKVPLWVKYPVRTALCFRKPREHRLHELLLVFANRQYPFWSVSVAELRRLMGNAAKPISNDHIVTKVIEPAALVIEGVTRWHIKIERFPHPRIAPTQTVRFTIRRPGSPSR